MEGVPGCESFGGADGNKTDAWGQVYSGESGRDYCVRKKDDGTGVCVCVCVRARARARASMTQPACIERWLGHHQTCTAAISLARVSLDSAQSPAPH